MLSAAHYGQFIRTRHAAPPSWNLSRPDYVERLIGLIGCLDHILVFNEHGCDGFCDCISITTNDHVLIWDWQKTRRFTDQSSQHPWGKSSRYHELVVCII